MPISEHFITSYRVRLKVADMVEVSGVEFYKDGRWRFRIKTYPMYPDPWVAQYHYTIYKSEFEARAVREALRAHI